MADATRLNGWKSWAASSVRMPMPSSLMSASAEPASGSERHMVPVNRPSIMGSRKSRFCSSVPKERITLPLPRVRPE